MTGGMRNVKKPQPVHQFKVTSECDWRASNAEHMKDCPRAKSTGKHQVYDTDLKGSCPSERTKHRQRLTSDTQTVSDYTDPIEAHTVATPRSIRRYCTQHRAKQNSVLEACWLLCSMYFYDGNGVFTHIAHGHESNATNHPQKHCPLS